MRNQVVPFHKLEILRPIYIGLVDESHKTVHVVHHILANLFPVLSTNTRGGYGLRAASSTLPYLSTTVLYTSLAVPRAIGTGGIPATHRMWHWALLGHPLVLQGTIFECTSKAGRRHTSRTLVSVGVELD